MTHTEMISGLKGTDVLSKTFDKQKSQNSPLPDFFKSHEILSIYTVIKSVKQWKTLLHIMEKPIE